MEIKEIRLENLLALAKREGQDLDFCKRIDMNPSYLPQLKSRSKAIGDKIARKIEERLGLERGYMDSIHVVDEAHPTGPAPRADVMSVAYSIESMPEPIREQFKRLVLSICAHCSTPEKQTASEHDIEPFEVKVPQRRFDERHQVSKTS